MLPLIMIHGSLVLYENFILLFISWFSNIFQNFFFIFFLTFLFQFPAWEFYKLHLWALLCYPCSHILIAIHPVRGAGLSTWEARPDALLPYPHSLVSWVPPPLALSQTLGTVMRTLQPCRWHGRGVGALEASPYLGASSTQGIWHIADLEDAH